MWRWLPCTIAGACLALAATCIVLWVRSYLPYDAGVWSGAGDELRLGDAEFREILAGSSSGTLYFLYDALTDWSRQAGLVRGMSIPGRYSGGAWELYVHRTRAALTIGVACPHWLILTFSLTIAAGALLPVIRQSYRASAWRRDRRCEKCGYDLRASPDRCPECGTPRTNANRNPTPPQDKPGVEYIGEQAPAGRGRAEGGQDS